jgi:hypothetical protein
LGRESGERGPEVLPLPTERADAMQFTLNAKNAIVGVLVIAGGYYAYRTFYGDVQIDDMQTLLRMHRNASAVKQISIKSRIQKIYEHDKHYDLLIDSLDSENEDTQMLAIEVLGDNREVKALPRMIDKFLPGKSPPSVDVELCRGLGAFKDEDAVVQCVPRLIQLTGEETEHDVRVAAHDALRDILQSGAQVKFGKGMQARWTELWRSHRKNPRK